MNKTDIIESMARDADISQATARRALESALGRIRLTLREGNQVAIVGFGTFKVHKRAARIGRNPRTGEALKIKAARVPKFFPGKAFKDSVN